MPSNKTKHMLCVPGAVYLLLPSPALRGLLLASLPGRASERASTGELPCTPKCRRHGVPGFAAGGFKAPGPRLGSRKDRPDLQVKIKDELTRGSLSL